MYIKVNYKIQGWESNLPAYLLPTDLAVLIIIWSNPNVKNQEIV